ncbi:hypothetical protein CFC21_085785 [Triticum aestivum]|uniref:NB-ARC domain-containing protein n=2 Tax=Triticum aestivum TaxID=4565 RepID=A0A9R1L8Z3_WHEAT|nr:hypothetical protein CFC21_085785 [Triticum aestivum]
MAEFALGLTKTAVAGTVSRVKLAVQEEKKLRESVEEDLVFITGEFEMMQAFLSASSAGERTSKNKCEQQERDKLHGQVVPADLARGRRRSGAARGGANIRDLAFDVENCVEFVVHLDKPSPWDWMRRLASSTPCLSSLSLPLDLAAAEIKRLKARVEDVSQSNTRYNLTGGGGSDDNGNNDNDYDYNYDDSDSDSDLHQEQNQVRMRPAVSTTSVAAATFQDLRVIWKAMGKLRRNTRDLKILIDCQGSGLKVITLWGSVNADAVGDSGRVSILKKAYLDQEICQQFKSRAWIKLTNTFNPVEFLNNLLTHFTSHRHVRHHDVHELMVQVCQHRYLIILEEELSSFAEWEAIKIYLPDSNNGSRVVISTKHLGVALVCTGEPFQVWELQHYSRNQYLCAFFPKVIT